MYQFVGYGIIIIYALVLYAIYRIVKKRYGQRQKSIDGFVFAGRNVPAWVVTASVFSAWTWVTSIIGSAEACVMYGLSGAIGYSLGAVISFFLMILLILCVRKAMPNAAVFLEFMGERYTKGVKDIYYIFAILTIVYVAIEQAAGIGFVINGLYGVSYKMIAFSVVIIALVFVFLSGMRGVLCNEVLNFAVVLTGFITLSIVLLQSFDMERIYAGILDARDNASNYNYNPDILNIAYKAGVRYFIMAIIIALGQILFDPGYDIKAYMAKDLSAARRGFLIGGIIIWGPLSLASALLLGFSVVAFNMDFSNSVNISADIPTKLLTMYFGNPIIILFTILIVCVGITTIIHYLVGVLGVFSIDFYQNKIKEDATEAEKLRFGKSVMILVGVFCALIATSLENISLLTIDMFCGVFFAAPCGAFFMAFLSKKDLKNLPILSIVLGLVIGFYVWVFGIEDNDMAWFYGTITAFFVPLAFLSVSSFVIYDKFNFAKLRFWDRN